MFLLKNTYTKKQYILDTLWYSFALFIVFCSICFISLPGLSVFASICVLVLLVLFVTSVSTVLTFRRGRNAASLWVNSLLPLEIYAVLAYMPYYKTEIIILIAAIVIISLLFTVLMLFCKNVRLGIRIKASGAGMRATAAVCLVMLVLPIGLKSVFGHGFLFDKTEVVNGCSDTSEWTAENKAEVLSLLKEENWKTLGVKEKMAVLATVKNIEINYLGIDHEIYIEADELEMGVAGMYNPRFRTLTIDIRHLENGSAAECLNTVLHECYHAYQYMMASMYLDLPENYRNMHMFRMAEIYAKELDNYNDGRQDTEGYYAQNVESEARSYAYDAAGRYMET